MSVKTQNFNIDPLSAPIPGMSFADTQGQRPYEKPALLSSPEDALERILESIKEPSSYKIIIQLMDAGISAETIASSLVLKMFAEGVISPDVAEIIKPMLLAYITEMAIDAGVDDINVVNELPSETMSGSHSLDLMKKINPQKFKRRMDNFEIEDTENQLASIIEFPEEDLQERQSFLDMGAS